MRQALSCQAFRKGQKGTREKKEKKEKKSSLPLPLPSFHISLFQRTTKAKPKKAEVLVFFCSCYFLLLFKLTLVIRNGPTLPYLDLPLGFLPSLPPNWVLELGVWGGVFSHRLEPHYGLQVRMLQEAGGLACGRVSLPSALPHLTSDQMDKVLPPAPCA